MEERDRGIDREREREREMKSSEGTRTRGTDLRVLEVEGLPRAKG